jgi:RNA polymerase sigma-70 factor (ECF subfamily)
MIHYDPALIRRCQEGDLLAFKELVQACQQPVYNLAMKLLNDVGDAEDIVQDVFVKIWQGMKKYNDGISQFSTWMYKLTYNASVDKLRRRQKNRFSGDVEMASASVSLIDSFDNLEYKDLLQWIEKLTLALSPLQKTIFVLRDLEELEVKEVVEITGLTAKQVKDNLYLARKTMKQKLANIL